MPDPTSPPLSVEETIRRLEFDTGSAQRRAQAGQLEVWIHKYLMTGKWANPALSRGLLLQKRWWNGPLEIPLERLTRIVGPEAGMEYRVDPGYWVERIGTMAKAMTRPLAIPPLIVEYRGTELRVSDGNTRLGAMQLLQWPACWVVIWYNSEHDYQEHSAQLSGNGMT